MHLTTQGGGLVCLRRGLIPPSLPLYERRVGRPARPRNTGQHITSASAAARQCSGHQPASMLKLNVQFLSASAIQHRHILQLVLSIEREVKVTLGGVGDVLGLQLLSL